MVRCAFRAAIFGATFFNNHQFPDKGKKNKTLKRY